LAFKDLGKTQGTLLLLNRK